VEYFALSTLYEKLHLANFENLKPSDKAKKKKKENIKNNKHISITHLL
jgi:hypothetical protein